MSDDVPLGWTTTWLETLAARAPYPIGDGDHGQIKPACYTDKGVPYIRVADMGWGKLIPKGLVHIPESVHEKNLKSELLPGDILIAKTGATIGKCCIIPPSMQRANTTASVGKVTVNRDATIPEWILYYFLTREFKDQMWAVSEKTAQPGFNVRDLKLFRIPLAPLAEQHRIVAKLEALLSKVSRTQQRLSHLPTLLKRFRQSVLAAACSGKLTADWREENETNDTGGVLFSQIKSARLQQAKTAKEIKQIDGSFDSRVPEVTDDELGFDTLPKTWRRCRIGAAGAVCNGSTPSRQQPSFWDGDIPWVSSGEVRNNRIATTRERITKAGFDGTSVRLLPRGTVLVAMIGEGKTRGQSAILEIDATINQNIAAVIISHGLVDSTFLWRWFQMRYEATREEGGGSGPQALNCERVRELPFVLPPLAEQQEIVRRVEKLFAFADRIEARLKQAQSQVDRLTQSILAKAFRGELVPTEAELARREGRSYQSAGELLERIQATKTVAAPTISKRKQPRSS